MSRASTDRFDMERGAFVLGKGRRRFYNVPHAAWYLRKHENLENTEAIIHLKRLVEAAPKA